MAIAYEYVGKTGGGGRPLTFSPASPSTSVTVDLPDGEWAVAIRGNSSHFGRAWIRINGENFQNTGTGTSGGQNVWGLARHRSGSMIITTSSSSLVITEVHAFPDPA